MIALEIALNKTQTTTARFALNSKRVLVVVVVVAVTMRSLNALFVPL